MAGVRRLTSVLKEALKELKSYQTALSATEKLFMIESIDVASFIVALF